MELGIRREEWPIAGVFNISRGPQTVARVIVVELSVDGFRGRAECEPQAHYGESMESVLEQIEAQRERLRAGLDRGGLQALLPPGAARNALDCALWDLRAQRSATPVWKLAGLGEPRPLTTVYTISLAALADMARQAAGYRDWPMLKLKLGPAQAIECVRAVRAVAPETRLIADANEAWSFAQLCQYSDALHELGVELIEQPLPAAEDEALADYRGPVPLCADESCHTADSLDAVKGKYSYVNIKLDKTGGLTEALHLAETATSRGLRLMTGCMTGTSLAMAPATLVAGLSDFVDLDGPLLLARDREPGLQYQRGRIFLPAPEVWG